MREKYPLKLGLFFSFIVFSIMLASVIIICAVAFIAFRFGVWTKPNPDLAILIMLLVSVVIGTIISAVVGKRILAPIVIFSRATMKVAKGNFNIYLDEDKVHIHEVTEMTRNFNIMVKELSNIETFRNDFVANVSHEFKTPIAAIEGYATLLQDDNLTKEEKDEYVSKILMKTRHLSSLAGNILKIARLENQEIVVEKKNYRLDEQIRQALLSLETKWTAKNINLDIEMDSVNYYGNEELLMQVWINILGNAVKFTSENGTISIALQKVENNIVATISDDGIGMSKDTQKHIFEKFYQGDKSHYEAGNGLGLTLVKRIIDLCDGKIQVKSELGIGTMFIVNLPC
ncbi:HAMP domain-containing sensor histidine kinase [Clostridium cellulovorans]|uniref:histidine kinase n=1 Tax=Clostridium cellulovorans (strain ATCC 35296 / DSM 3052 / OCM 3 / 743B) TaxID=573061 RepID=D9SSW7_CLOC7|nr:HAMP domain-containing sensor histidine kinase [Clostridium cellulovorans]ADL52629.1 integral membrane sensor signal transduction histidine kinase [Clostridium cellulovorans 743B]